MFDINNIYLKSKPTKKLVIFKPDQCPFRFTALYYEGEEDYCGYLKSLDKIVEKRISFGGYTHVYEDDADTACCCTDDRWIKGCPLLNNNFVVVKN